MDLWLEEKLLANSTVIYKSRKESCKHIPYFSHKEKKKKKKHKDCTVKGEFFCPSLRISLEWSCTQRVSELLEKCPGLA